MDSNIPDECHPHPDTVRLNWLIEHEGELCTGNSGGHKVTWWKGFHSFVTGWHDDPRSAIDEAMKQQEQDDG